MFSWKMCSFEVMLPSVIRSFDEISAGMKEIMSCYKSRAYVEKVDSVHQ